MDIRNNTIALVALVCAAPAALRGQFDFNLAGRPVQVHSFASQGFAYSNQNNYLTMKTSQGSFDMTDLGFNVSMPVTDRFHVGAQLYSYNVGALGRYRPQLDWAVADYRFKDWFGIRGGKIKTALGLFNETRRTWSFSTPARSYRNPPTRSISAAKPSLISVEIFTAIYRSENWAI